VIDTPVEARTLRVDADDVLQEAILRAPPFSAPPDDPTMRALEAYTIAQRKGVPLDYGKRQRHFAPNARRYVDSELLARSFNNCPRDSRNVPVSLAFFRRVMLGRVKPFLTVSALTKQLGLCSFVWNY
jgi:hypothetical protein